MANATTALAPGTQNAAAVMVRASTSGTNTGLVPTSVAAAGRRHQIVLLRLLLHSYPLGSLDAPRPGVQAG